MRGPMLCLSVFALALFPSLLGAATLSYPGPYSSLQDAVDAANPGDIIEVAPGFYVEEFSFLGKAIVIRSVAGPDNTVLDSGFAGGTTVKCVSGEGPDSVLEGFTIMGSNGTQMEPGVFAGLCMLNIDSSPTVLNCIFRDSVSNTAVLGSAIANYSASPQIRDTVFQELVATQGAAIYATESSAPQCHNCTFVYCVTQPSPSGAPALDGGGAIYSQLGSHVQVTNSTFENGFADQGVGGVVLVVGDGSAIMPSASLANCLFVNNDAEEGGVLRTIEATATLTNCTLTQNSAVTGGALVVDEATIQNCIIWDNGPAAMVGGYVASYSSLQGVAPVGTNISANPAFVGAAVGDFQLAPGSPCIDRADADADINLQVAGLQSIPDPDLAGNDRFQDDPLTADLGVGFVEFLDMGCYEFAEIPPAAPYISGDFNVDATVNVGDAIAVLGFLFPNGPAMVPACEKAGDVNGDMVINIADAVHLLAYLFSEGDEPTAPFPECGTCPNSDCPLPCDQGPVACP